MRSLRLLLRCSWDHRDQSVLVWWDSECQRDLEGWLVRSLLEEGVSLSQVSPNLDFWSDASGRGLGGTSGRRRGFRLLVSSKRQGTSGGGERPTSFCSPSGKLDCCSVCGQFYCCYLPAQSRGNLVSSLERYCTANPPLGRVSNSSSCSTVYHGEEQCPGGRSLQAQSDPGLGVDAETGSLPGSTETLVSDDRHFRHLVESPMFSLFFALPRSECLGYGCSSSELGRLLSGVCLSTLVLDTPGSEEAPLIFWNPHDTHCSVVASETLVPGTSVSCRGQCSSSSVVSRSAQTASFPPSSSGNIQAVSSCVETLR